MKKECHALLLRGKALVCVCTLGRVKRAGEWASWGGAVIRARFAVEVGDDCQRGVVKPRRCVFAHVLMLTTSLAWCNALSVRLKGILSSCGLCEHPPESGKLATLVAI